MGEYINRENVKQMIDKAIDQANPLCRLPLMEVSAIICNLPAADVAPVVHGYWIFEPETLYTKPRFECSVCRSTSWLSPDVPRSFKYCPNCGALMDLEGPQP